jgi:hypothetical protein
VRRPWVKHEGTYIHENGPGPGVEDSVGCGHEGESRAEDFVQPDRNTAVTASISSDPRVTSINSTCQLVMEKNRPLNEGKSSGFKYSTSPACSFPVLADKVGGGLQPVLQVHLGLPIDKVRGFAVIAQQPHNFAVLGPNVLKGRSLATGNPKDR